MVLGFEPDVRWMKVDCI